MSLGNTTRGALSDLLSSVCNLRIGANRRQRISGCSRSPRSRSHRVRSLRVERLETRQLLAADLQPFQHNRFDPEDVNDDGFVSPADVLHVINSINQSSQADGNGFVDVNDDGQRSPVDVLLVINRLNRDRQRWQPALDSAGIRQPVPLAEVRSIDGTANNLANPELGSTDENLLRVADAGYGDGIASPAGDTRPSAREISNKLAAADEAGIFSERGLSAFIYVWGQFIDHDIDLTLNQADGEILEIAIPVGDPMFDPSGSGDVVMPLTRSEFDPATGTSIDNPRQQVSRITAFVDASMVYGYDQATADRLRTFEGGQLIIDEHGLLPLSSTGEVLAGDIRAGENLALTSVQTLFVREHNRLANELAMANSDLSDEEVYQLARAQVIAEIQAITYNEFLPALLGKQAINRYQGYDASVDPTIANEFSTAAFRFGHSTLNDDIGFFDNQGRAVRDELSLSEAFFAPSILYDTGIDSVLKYEASSQSQEVDLQVVDSLRNFLFGPPGAGGLDLASLNIQRGRDHGLADYNATRVAYGLAPIDSFDDITSDVDQQQKLAELYGDVDDIDLWIGLLAEDHLRGASVGQLTQTIIADQFERLRDGDRFWYETQFHGSQLRQLQQTSLADIIERNTTLDGLQDNVFFMVAEVSGQVRLAPPQGGGFVGAQGFNGQRHPPVSKQEGLAGVTVELVNSDGAVIETSVTDERGNYRFQSISETGDYQIRLAESADLQLTSASLYDLLISNGATRLRGFDFEVVQV